MPFFLLVFTELVVLLVDAKEHLGKDAPETPDIDGAIVVFFKEDNFWWAVPPGHHMVRK